MRTERDLRCAYDLQERDRPCPRSFREATSATVVMAMCTAYGVPLTGALEVDRRALRDALAAL